MALKAWFQKDFFPVIISILKFHENDEEGSKRLILMKLEQNKLPSLNAFVNYGSPGVF
jgi:hypothetical protein